MKRQEEKSQAQPGGGGSDPPRGRPVRHGNREVAPAAWRRRTRRVWAAEKSSERTKKETRNGLHQETTRKREPNAAARETRERAARRVLPVRRLLRGLRRQFRAAQDAGARSRIPEMESVAGAIERHCTEIAIHRRKSLMM